jgi:hypothetical protein
MRFGVLMEGTLAAVGTHTGSDLITPPGAKGIYLEALGTGGGVGVSTGQISITSKSFLYAPPQYAVYATAGSTFGKATAIDFAVLSVPTADVYTAFAGWSTEVLYGWPLPAIWRPQLVVGVDTLTFSLQFYYLF